MEKSFLQSRDSARVHLCPSMGIRISKVANLSFFCVPIGLVWPSNYASAAARRSLGYGWRLSCTASGPQLQGSLGSIGLRPMPPHC